MFPLRNFAAAFRSGITALRSNVVLNNNPSNASPGITMSQSGFQVRNFSSKLMSYASAQMTQPRLIASGSSLPTLASRNAGTIFNAYNNLLVNPSRSIMKNFWPRPRETKRVKKLGWNTRMATPNGRRIIMRRILKGRHSLTH